MGSLQEITSIILFNLYLIVSVFHLINNVNSNFAENNSYLKFNFNIHVTGRIYFNFNIYVTGVIHVRVFCAARCASHPIIFNKLDWFSAEITRLSFFYDVKTHFCPRSSWVRRASEHQQSLTHQVAHCRCKKGGNTHLQNLSNGKLKCIQQLCPRGVAVLFRTKFFCS